MPIRCASNIGPVASARVSPSDRSGQVRPTAVTDFLRDHPGLARGPTSPAVASPSAVAQLSVRGDTVDGSGRERRRSSSTERDPDRGATFDQAGGRRRACMRSPWLRPLTGFDIVGV